MLFSALFDDSGDLKKALSRSRIAVLATSAAPDNDNDNDARESSFFVSMVSGAAAGVAVDVSLFPIDTIKTRMQTPEGFFKAGGFRGIYNGIGAAALGSAPGAATFFTVYDTAKKTMEAMDKDEEYRPLIHMGAASIGEVFACLVRVPTENVKQKQQAGIYKSLGESVRGIRASAGLGGFYKGYSTTVMREIPFSFIQFPLWEAGKSYFADQQNVSVNDLPTWQVSLLGSLSGGLAAAITTPLDVAKTRQMLDVDGTKYTGMVQTLRKVAAEEGAAALMSGVQPRVMWISIGGFVFFGGYETTRKLLS